jgi:hypothetical protein
MMASAVASADKSFQAARPVALFQTHIVGGGTNFNNRPQYAVSADGRFLINASSESSTAVPITLIYNWRPQPAKDSRLTRNPLSLVFCCADSSSRIVRNGTCSRAAGVEWNQLCENPQTEPE